jgi:hypothetical protein
MRIFLIVLVASTGAAILLWNFGIASLIWPAHPFLATLGVATAGAAALQLVLTYSTFAKR